MRTDACNIHPYFIDDSEREALLNVPTHGNGGNGDGNCGGGEVVLGPTAGATVVAAVRVRPVATTTSGRETVCYPAVERAVARKKTLKKPSGRSRAGYFASRVSSTIVTTAAMPPPLTSLSAARTCSVCQSHPRNVPRIRILRLLLLRSPPPHLLSPILSPSGSPGTYHPSSQSSGLQLKRCRPLAIPAL